MSLILKEFLEKHREQQKSITVFLKNGVKLEGLIKEFDDTYLVLTYAADCEMIIKIDPINTYTDKKNQSNSGFKNNNQSNSIPNPIKS